MNEKSAYYKYEEKTAASRLKRMNKIQTFKMGLELSEFALKTLFRSFQDQYKNFSRKTMSNKFRSFLRTI